MASKRTKNRAYWIAVKAQLEGDNTVISASHLYRRILAGMPDRIAVPLVEKYEKKYGPARLADVSDSTLWPHRRTIDAIRDNTESA